MRHFLFLFSDSLKEFKKIRTLTTVSLLTAVAVVLGFFSITLGDYIKISFAFIANEMVGMLFGPVVGSIMGGVTDILKYIVKPTGPFFFGFTFNAILGGLIYGIMLYKKPLRLINIIITNVIVMIFINILLTTYWLSILYGNGFFVILPMRILKELIMCPIEIALFYTCAKSLEKAGGLKKIVFSV